MNDETEKKIDAALNALRESARKQFEASVRKFAGFDHMDPLSVTDAMIHAVARAAHENSLQLLELAAKEVSAVQRTLDAYGLLKRSMVNHHSDLSALVKLWRGSPLQREKLQLAAELFASEKQYLLENVEAYRHRFKNQGGSPGIYNWEPAYAYIRAKYPSGIRYYRGLQTHLAEELLKFFEALYGAGNSPERTIRMRHAKILVNELRRG